MFYSVINFFVELVPNMTIFLKKQAGMKLMGFDPIGDLGNI
jgi:hypothetical protein